MASYLITCKPASENRERGYALEELQNLVRRLRSGHADNGNWRFQNTHAESGNRIFLLIQGRLGPAIIGYGQVTGEPGRNDAGERVVPIKFESLVDPSMEVLVKRDTLLAIPESQHIWSIPFSGMQLKDNIATILEALVVGRIPVTVVVTDDTYDDLDIDQSLLGSDGGPRFESEEIWREARPGGKERSYPPGSKWL